MKNKTYAVWLTLVLGCLGLHRLYLRGRFDLISVCLLLPSLAGFYGVVRTRNLGVDDTLGWLLCPLLGFSLAASCLSAIVYGLMDSAKWNQRFNPSLPEDAIAGQTQWLTIGGVIVALLIGSVSLLSGITYSFQRYFEYQSVRAENALVNATAPSSAPQK